MIPPAEFIPVAEEIGLIVPLGEWVLRKACVDAASWPDDIKVAVNLSPIQVTNQNLVPIVVSALAAAGLPARRLEVEITESVLMHNTETTIATLHRLRELGVQHLDGRFRHRLFVAELSAQIPVRQDQDRPLVHLGPAGRQRFHRDRAGGRGARGQPQHDGDRRRRRDRGAAGDRSARSAASRCRAICSAGRCRWRRSCRCSSRSGASSARSA